MGHNIHHQKTDRQLKALFKRKCLQNICDFKDEGSFLDWYRSQPGECSICGVLELDLQKLISANLLESKRFPQNGLIQRGRTRGWWLEVDRNNPIKNYSEENCTLVCYFCNNDKSDVFQIDEYRKFRNNRYGYIKNLVDVLK
jgi:hypothetical protein